MSSYLEAAKSFGGIDADSDALLDECFEDHEAYKSARKHENFLILGRKGSGKTAIFRNLTKINEASSFSYGHTFSDYPWHHHEKQKKIGVPDEQCFVHSWEYLIYITLSKMLLNQDASQPWSDEAASSMAGLETFIMDTYGSRNPDMSQVFSPTRSLKIKDEFGVDWKIFKGKLSGERVPMEWLPIVIQEVNRTLLQSIINCANPCNEYFVCFDELDLGFNPNNKDYPLQLIGLLLAARRINNATRQAGKKVSIVIFLRDDIYQILQFEDKNKLTQSSVSIISWDENSQGKTLKSLMEKRFSKVLGIPEEGAWNVVFDETKEMTGHQTKYQHILDRTFLRPCDIIRFSNEILKYHQRSLDRESNAFENKDIISARPGYSEYLLNELDDEVPKHLPHYKTYLEVLKTVNSLQFTLDEIGKACEDRKSILPPNVGPRELLAQLFEFSIIGYYRPGGGGFGGAEYIWRHKDRRAMFNENAVSYRVHAGLMEVLGLKKYSRSS